MNDHRFLLEVAKALAGCQEIELELKAYISHALSNIRGKVNGAFPFKFHGSDYDEASLETLIKVFSKLSDNADLVRRLNQFKKKRNSLAHMAIARCMNDDGKLDPWKTSGAYADITTVRTDSELILNEIFKEHSGLFTIDSNVPIPPAGPGDIDA
jgi:hypothetical protein